MQAKSFALPGIFGFSTPVVRSEHKAYTRRVAPKVVRRSNALPQSHVRSMPMRRAGTRSLSLQAATRTWLGAGLLVTVVIASITYVFGINSYSATGYEIKKQQIKVSQLQEENKKLMVKAAEVGSIVQLQNESSIASMVGITNQEFLQDTHLSQR